MQISGINSTKAKHSDFFRIEIRAAAECRLSSENLLHQHLVDRSVGREQPLAAASATVVTRLFEQTQAGRVVGGGAAPQLVQMQGIARIALRGGESIGRETAATERRSNDYATPARRFCGSNSKRSTAPTAMPLAADSTTSRNWRVA